MPRGTTLANLLAMLKAEIGDNATGNTIRDNELKQLLANKQQLLASTYSFAFLERKWDVVVPVATRYVTIPTTTATGSDFAATGIVISMEHQIMVEVFWGTVWLPVEYGVDQMDLSVFNSDIAGRTYPQILRWRWASNVNDTAPTTANQIEVWPVPSVAQTIRITGQRALKALTSDSDTADLDDIMLVNFVAADKLTMSGQLENAKLKLAIANQRLTNLKASYPERQERLIMGQDSYMTREDRRAVPMVVIAP